MKKKPDMLLKKIKRILQNLKTNTNMTNTNMKALIKFKKY